MSALGRLPFDDYADPDPNALPFDARACGACGAGSREPCRVGCIGEAAHDEELQRLADVARADYFRQLDGEQS